jgi:hypothetical protein
MKGIQRRKNNNPANPVLHTRLTATEGDHVPAMNSTSNLATPPLVTNLMIAQIPDETTTSGKVPSGD